jgi:hypothetical protein
MNFIKAIAGAIVSYVFCDDPTPNPEFDKLTFWGRVMLFKKQLEKEK